MLYKHEENILNNWLTIKEFIFIGANEIYFELTNMYSHDGHGFHKSIIDKRVYMYWNCEPYYANKIFPCFDQPDIKGIYNLEIECDKKYIVLSNEEKEYEKEHENIKLVKFKKTKIFSSYLFCFVVGEYFECGETYIYDNY